MKTTFTKHPSTAPCTHPLRAILTTLRNPLRSHDRADRGRSGRGAHPGRGLGPSSGGCRRRCGPSGCCVTQPVATDSAGMLAILGDPRTVEHNPSDRLEDRGEASALVARWVRHWEDHGFGYWCVRESRSDRIIGYAGVKRMLIHGRPVLNLVYRFVPEVWGRGFATEAASAVVSRALDDMPADRRGPRATRQPLQPERGAEGRATTRCRDGLPGGGWPGLGLHEPRDPVTPSALSRTISGAGPGRGAGSENGSLPARPGLLPGVPVTDRRGSGSLGQHPAEGRIHADA